MNNKAQRCYCKELNSWCRNCQSILPLAYYDCPNETLGATQNHCYRCEPDKQQEIEIRYFDKDFYVIHWKSFMVNNEFFYNIIPVRNITREEGIESYKELMKYIKMRQLEELLGVLEKV